MNKKIYFSKSELENKYILKEESKKEKMEIDSTNLNLYGKLLYNTFFANNKFNKGDTFELKFKINSPSSVEKHIFEKLVELFKDIQNELNK